MWETHPLYRRTALLFLRCFDNHDIANDNNDERPERNGRRTKVDAALALIFTMNGVPFLYNNGQEVADGRRHSLFSNRLTGKNLVVDWPRGAIPEDKERMQLIGKLIELRRGCRALLRGETVKIDNNTPKQVMSYLRRTPEEAMLIAINLSDDPAKTELAVSGAKIPAVLPPGGWLARHIQV